MMMMMMDDPLKNDVTEEDAFNLSSCVSNYGPVGRQSTTDTANVYEYVFCFIFRMGSKENNVSHIEYMASVCFATASV